MDPAKLQPPRNIASSPDKKQDLSVDPKQFVLSILRGVEGPWLVPIFCQARENCIINSGSCVLGVGAFSHLENASLQKAQMTPNPKQFVS